MLHAAPLAFDASTFEIWGPLIRGGAVAVSPLDLPTPRELERLLTLHRITVLWLTSSLFNLIVDERPDALKTVGHVITGGEALSVPHVERALAALPATILINGYGPTETTTFATYHIIERDVRGRASIPIGRPLDNTRVYVLDARQRPVAQGLPGDLWIGGDGVDQTNHLDRVAAEVEVVVEDADPFAVQHPFPDLCQRRFQDRAGDGRDFKERQQSSYCCPGTSCPDNFGSKIQDSGL